MMEKGCKELRKRGKLFLRASVRMLMKSKSTNPIPVKNLGSVVSILKLKLGFIFRPNFLKYLQICSGLVRTIYIFYRVFR